MNMTADGTYPFQVSRGKEISIAISGTFDGATVTLAYATAAPVVASATLVDGDTENALTLTAAMPGAGGNDMTVTVEAGAAANAPLALTQSGLDFTITLATGPGDAATVTTAMTGENNDLTITADAAGPAGNDYSVELLAGSGTTQALSVATVDGLKFSVTLGRTANAISSTATQVAAALNAYAPFAALMTAAVKDGDTGAGVVTALSETALEGGGANFAITSTYAEILALLNANERWLSAHFTAALVDEYDGDTVAAAQAETSFTSGSAGTFATYPAATERPTAFTAAGYTRVINVGVSNLMALVVTSADTGTDITANFTK
jgi:hypothetical protein